MKGYFYKTNGYEGILITNGNKWISFTDSEKIDGLYCGEENAMKIGENFKQGIADGGFDDYEFNDWYENTGAGTSQTSGTGVKKFLNECETYYRIF